MGRGADFGPRRAGDDNQGVSARAKSDNHHPLTGRYSWRSAWQKMELLIPDKFEMARTASLLWVSGQEDARCGRGDNTHHFAAIHAGLVVLEELFRAVYERHGRRVLRVQNDGPDRVRCELAILDNRAGELLDPAALRDITDTAECHESFAEMMVAVRELRDHVLHAAWHALADEPQMHHHLIAKAIYWLCDGVEMPIASDDTSLGQP